MDENERNEWAEERDMAPEEMGEEVFDEADSEEALEKEEEISEETPEEEAPDETSEEASEEGNADEISEEDSEEGNPDEIPEEAPDAAAQPLKLGVGAVLAMVGVVVLAFVMLVPAIWNARLTAPAVKGLALEAARRCNGAASAYSDLLMLEQETAAWGAENFSFGEEPAFSTASYALKRFVPLVYKLDGLLAAHEMASQYVPKDARVPLRLRRLLERMEPLDAIDENIQASLSPAITEVDLNGNPVNDEQAQLLFWMEAVRAAREKDKAKDRKLFYDSRELNYAAAIDVTSDDVGRLLAALKKEAGSEPWMYENVEIMRAWKMEDFATMAEGFAARLKRSRDEDSSLVARAKALYLSGDKAQAEKLIKKYGKGRTLGNMAALRAELLLREGKYKEAIAICDEAIAKGAAMTEEMTEPLENGGGIMEAVAQKAAALLLQGKTQEAYTLLDETAAAPYGAISQNYLCMMLAAAILAEDTETVQGLAMYMQQRGYTLPAGIFEMETSPEGIMQNVRLLKTIKEICTEGWGGF